MRTVSLALGIIGGVFGIIAGFLAMLLGGAAYQVRRLLEWVFLGNGLYLYVH